MSWCARASRDQVLDRPPRESAFGDQEEKRREHGQGEDQHLDESEETELAKDDREGVHEDDFDVEDHENHRDQIEPNGESLRRFDFGDNPALVRCQLRVRGSLPRRQQR